MTLHPEVLFAAVYAVFLLIIAELLRWKGSRAQYVVPTVSKDDLSWSHWQAGRFRIGLSRILLALAAYILCVAAYRYHKPFEACLVSLVGLIVAWEAVRGRAQ